MGAAGFAAVADLFALALATGGLDALVETNGFCPVLLEMEPR